MPYKTMNEVPDNLKTMDDVALSLNQVNAMSAMADAMISDGSEKSMAWATAKKRFKENHEVEGDKWRVKRRNDMEHVGFKFDKPFSSFADARSWMEENDIAYLSQNFVERDRQIYYRASVPNSKDVKEMELIPGVVLQFTKKENYKKDRPMETVNFYGVEVFAAGSWTPGNSEDGKPIPVTERDLDDMVDAYKGLKSSNWDFPIKLTHGDEQMLLERENLPAAGYIENVRRDGKKLVADLMNVPKKIGDLIRVGAIKKRSAEIFRNVRDEVTGKVYKRAMLYLALLGKDIPAINSLSDITNLYQSSSGDSEVFTYSCKQVFESIDKKNESEVLPMDKAELEKLLEDRDNALMEKFAKLIKPDVEAKDETDEKADEYKKQLDAEKEAIAKEREEFEAKEKELERFKAEKAEAEKAAEKKAVEEFRALLGKKIEPAKHDSFVGDYSRRDADGRKVIVDMVEALPDNDNLETYSKTTENGKEKDINKLYTAWRKERDLEDNIDTYGRFVAEEIDYEAPETTSNRGENYYNRVHTNG